MAVGFGSYLTFLILFFKNLHGFFWGFMVYICYLLDAAEIYSGTRYEMGFQTPFRGQQIIRISWSLISYMGNNLSSVFCWTLSGRNQWAMSGVFFSVSWLSLSYQCWPKKRDWNTTYWWALFWNKFCRTCIWSILVRLVMKGAMIAN